ncbi:hypothetical protein D5H75_11835 [Bailinhaonella thermotolerans]|uniref:Uncharacterized protein n=1 Tax=Bailinhaonella thermotolerans TaxID=1070861 RepID=A0A3A4AV31_9ACTN|nr:hypothetical protein D5H75_11835 [Bailinhaonella thermotolerans]
MALTLEGYRNDLITPPPLPPNHPSGDRVVPGAGREAGGDGEGAGRGTRRSGGEGRAGADGQRG